LSAIRRRTGPNLARRALRLLFVFLHAEDDRHGKG
jgi:hypothetical protein